MCAKPFDFKVEFKNQYKPSEEPGLVEIPIANFIMLDGTGDPNDKYFEESVQMLYSLSFTLKMSNKTGNQPAGYFEYVTPPLEGLWWTDDGSFDFLKRSGWRWTIMIRQPDFFNREAFDWAIQELHRKKPHLDLRRIRFESFSEGKCVQAMHNGPYSTEQLTMQRMRDFIEASGLVDLVPLGAKHHEIYLKAAYNGDEATMRTILRHPVI
jgi:hypothetical protein